MDNQQNAASTPWKEKLANWLVGCAIAAGCVAFGVTFGNHINSVRTKTLECMETPGRTMEHCRCLAGGSC